MANVTFKKSLILLLFFLFFNFSSFSQKKKLDIFSNDFSVYLTELGDFMITTKNNKLKSVYKNFLKQSNTFSVSEKNSIIQISNKMLLKRLRANPHFTKFLSTVIKINDNAKGDVLLLDWLNVVTEMLDETTTNKLMLFCVFTSDLVSNNFLRVSNSVEWSISNTDFHFEFEMIEPVVVFDIPFDLTCNTDNGSYTIFDTKGKYYFISTEWLGEGGLINWESHGYAKDSVFAEIKSYKLDTRNNKVIADSSVFYNKYFFSLPIIGRVVNKISQGNKDNMFPEFTSYSKNVEMKEIFSNIDYRGGYKIQGKKFVADGGDYAQAKIVFKKDEKDILVANANRFIIDADRIISKEAGVKIFFDKDSIYHSNIHFKYIDSKRQLQLYKDVNSRSSAMMLNTYHNLIMDFELLQWDIDDDLIKFGSLPGSSTSKVVFESVARYDSLLYVELAGIDDVHPIFLINNYVREKQEEEIYIEDFARFAKFPLHQIQNLLARLSSYGFIFYDFGLKRITVLPKLYNYVNAASDLGDYDVLSFHSEIQQGQYITGDKHLVNATLNIRTKDLNILGINKIPISQERGIYLYPNNGLIIVKKNRDFLFNGQIFAGKGRLNLYGREFVFNYDDFKLDLNYIDVFQLSVPYKGADGKQALRPIKTVIESARGELRIDHPTNKSGVRKDVFSNFPIFNSFDSSFVYYGKKSIHNGVYDREDFSFHLGPFQIDSVDSFTGKGMFFLGSFKSAGIFPPFDDTLRLQQDFSYGFSRNAPDTGFVVYGGKAKYYNDVFLSDEGLKGSGDLEYLNSISSANEIFFFPDSANFYTQKFSISKVEKGIEFPEVNNKETYAHFEPYNDRLEISKTKGNFDLYQSQVEFNGNLLMRPTGLTGGGTMSLDKANVSSSFFIYNANWFKAERSNLEVFSNNGKLSIEAFNLKSHIDLKMREGVFNSSGKNSYVKFPENQYISFIDKLTWNMDEEAFVLGNQVVTSQGSEFVSIHADQDSLRFTAANAFYSLKDYIIYCSGVEEISVADAIIFPDSGVVTVAKNAVIETLYGAEVLVDDLTEYHTFTNATIDIKSSYNYIGSGNYTYKDDIDNEQQIFFKEIKVDKDTITIASGEVAKDKVFHINSRFDFKGNVNLIADQKDLIFDGFFLANHNCFLLDKEWIKFRSKINPYLIDFKLGEEIYNEKGDVLSASLVMSSLNTDIYSTFLNKKERALIDLDIIPASYSLKYDDEKSAYIVGGPDVVSNYYTLYDKKCQTFGEGIIDFNFNLGQVSLKSIGNISHDMHTKTTDFDGFIMLDFPFAEDAMTHMAELLAYSKDEEDFIYNENFLKNLSRVVGQEKAENLLFDLDNYSEYNEFPEKMKHSIVFAKTKLAWDSKNKSYVSKGKITIHSMMENHLNSTHDGYLIIEKGKKSDVLIIYLDTELDGKYYFRYENGVMQAWSDVLEFEIAINDISDKKRRFDRKKNVRSYRYMFVSEDVAMKSLNQIKKKY